MAQEPVRLLERIEIEGLTRTDERLVLSEIGLVPGDSVDDVVLDEALRRLRNLRVFASVHGRLEPVEGNGAVVLLQLEEKWTWLPVMRGGAGGGTFFYVLGTYDINAFGKYVELGIQNENYGGDNSLAVWCRNPRFLFTPLTMDLSGGRRRERRSIYGEKRSLFGAYSLQRDYVNLLAGQDFGPDLRIDLSLELADDRVNESGLQDEQLLANRNQDLHPDVRGKLISVQPQVSLGHLDYQKEMVRGLRLDLHTQSTVLTTESVPKHAKVFATLFFFHQVNDWLNFGTRIGAGYATEMYPPYGISLGGLTDVRGFLDGEFSGDRALYANLEARSTLGSWGWGILQHGLFVDMGQAARSADAMWRDWPVSVGTGLRTVLPYVSRVVVRVDYAWVMAPVRDSGVSISLRQFF